MYPPWPKTTALPVQYRTAYFTKSGGSFCTVRDGRIVIADRFYPSTQICSCCGCLTGPSVERWVCSECGAEHERDANAAINLRKLGLAKPRINARGHDASTGCVSIPASVVDEPRTETVRTIEHI
jgi:transposase